MVLFGTGRKADQVFMRRAPWILLVLPVCLLAAPAAEAQQSLPAVQRRLKDLEARVEELEAQAAEDRKDEVRKEVEKNYAKGIISLRGIELRLGGYLKIDFIDPQNERSTAFGNTLNPDPHMDVNKLRLSPRLDFAKSKVLGEVYAKTQVDIFPTKGDTVLKRATLNHEAKPKWWLASQASIGLWDRFIRPRRLTQNYPLIGTAFWRDQTVGVRWEGTLGAKRGKPAAAKRKSSRSSQAAAPGGGEGGDGEGGGGAAKNPPVEGDPGEPEALDAGGEEGEPVPSRASRTSSTEHAPFDIVRNPGALKLHVSITDGYGAAGKEIGRENDRFDEVLQDDRSFTPPLSLREVGLGVGYERDFRELGEIELLGFYFDDQLNDSVAAAITTETGIVTSSRDRSRRGVNAGYHFESYHLYNALDLLEALNPRKGDGLYLFYERIDARDGDLDRSGWYAQASFRLSNPIVPRWRYFRSLEPVIRYNELMPDIDHLTAFPATWTRRQWLAGVILEVVKEVYIRAEYTFNDEVTGGGKVANDELLIQLFARF